MVIPETINALPMREAFLFYRDGLKLNVRPLLGPWCSDPAKAGKAPTIKDYWKRPVMEWDVEKLFGGNGRCHNIGCGPKDNVIFVDLDSKPDKGKSVRDFIARHPDVLKGPWHDTANGVHLVFRCKDLPKADDVIKGHPCEGVTSELFHGGAVKCNIVLPPSVHVDAHIYRWAATGEVQEVSWTWLQETFKFEDAERTGKVVKDALWFLKFKGDLRSLDIVAMLEHLGHPAELEDADEGKHSILCPWHEEHGENGKRGTSTVVWEAEDAFPGFRCLHAHCDDKDLRALLEWAEKKEPEVVDRFCKRPRVFNSRYRDDQDRPQILHPDNELISDVYTKLGNIIGPKREWFRRGDSLVTINEVPSGFVYSNNPDTAYTVEAHTTGFREITPQEARSKLENYVIPGYIEPGTGSFIQKSFPTEFCISMVSADHLRKKLPHIVRVLTVPVPVRMGDQLVLPKEGYDERFGTFLVPDAPRIKEMPLKRALKILEVIHADFPFTTPQSKCHAIARLLTPFARGLLGWTTRVPLWFYIANRPRAGKDYLAIIPLLVYEGYGFEDLPIGREEEETRKRIMAGARSGRHFMHFSNCQGHLSDSYFCQAITAQVIAGRALGSNDGAADLILPNEMEFSASRNVGGTHREDFEGRMREIELAYYQEHANSRAFKNPFLHETIKEKRPEILSAIASLYRHWAEQGFPEGPTVFTSFPRWAQVVGGVMMAAKLGDPCLPFEGKFDDVGGDRQAEAMKALFMVCRAKFGDEWTRKKEVYACVHEAMKEGNDALGYFGELQEGESARSNQTKVGQQLLRFKGRELGGIVLLIEEKTNSAINKYRFIHDPDAPPECEPVNVCERSDIDGRLRGTPTDADKNGTSVGGSVKVSRAPDVHKGSTLTPFDGTLSDLSSGALAFDIETFAPQKVNKKGRVLKSKDALNIHKADIRLLNFCDSNGEVFLRDLLKLLIQDFEREILQNRELVAHSAAFDLRFIGTKLGISPQKVFCTMTASKLLLPGRQYSHKLGDVLERFLGIHLPKDQGASDWGGILTPEQIAYAENDVRYLLQLKAVLEQKLEEAGLSKVFEMEMALLPIIVKMECHGFPVDVALMGAVKEEADLKAGKFIDQLRREFGVEDLNPNSPQQLKKAFKELGVVLESTDKERMSRCEDFRTKTLKSYKYEDGISRAIQMRLKEVQDGRIYSKFSPTGTVTGRFSSKDPPLQNVHRDKKVRSCFVASGPDRKLIVVDYSQIELRVAALVANDEVMIEAFRNGEDLHLKSAASALGIPEGEVGKKTRDSIGKVVNFGFLYGAKEKRFRDEIRTKYELEISVVDSINYRRNHFNLYSGLDRWHKKCWKKAEDPQNNFSHTIMGRLLLAQGELDKDRFDVFTNYEVQGSSADLLKLSVIRADAVLPPSVHLISVVHDEVIYDAPEDVAEQCKQDICRVTIETFAEMFGTTVPAEVDAKVCANWSEK